MKYRHRDAIDILREIAELPPDEEGVVALRLAPKSVRSLLYFALSPTIDLDLPKGNLNIVPITGRVLSAALQSNAEEDLLGSEAARGVLVRIFAKGVNPALTSRRQLDIYLDLAQRVNDEERRVLECIRVRRCLPSPYDSLTPEVVTAAYGQNFLNTHPALVPTPEPYAQIPLAMEGAPVPIEDKPQPQPSGPRPLTESELRYREAMAKIQWG